MSFQDAFIAGPWKAEPNFVVTKVDGERRVIARMDGDGDAFACENIRFANARLIATAPEMVELLKRLLPRMHIADNAAITDVLKRAGVLEEEK